MSEEKLTEEKEKKLEDIKKEAEEKACPVQRALYFVEEFIAGPMCGKCYPCSLGTQEAKIRLIRISQHLENVSDSDIKSLKRIGSQMIEGSFCKKGKDTGRFIIETITSSEEDFNQHISGICPQKECVNLIEYVIDPILCIMCGKCLEVCKYDNVQIDPAASRSAEAEGVDIRLYNVIYKLIDDVDKALKGLLEPVYKDVVIGHAEVRAVFSIPRVGNIAGVYVTDGQITRNALARIRREKQWIYNGQAGSLKRFTEDVREVRAGFECGVGLEGFGDFKEGDIIEFYKKERES